MSYLKQTCLKRSYQWYGINENGSVGLSLRSAESTRVLYLLFE